MTIRSKLLWLLVPPLIAFVTLISLFFYYNWQREIITSFKDYLRAVVVSSSQSLDKDKISDLFQGNNLNYVENSPVYKELYDNLKDIKDTLALESLYIVRIENVRKGEPVHRDQPVSADNPRYEGKDSALAFRQIYLIDVADENSHATHQRKPGDIDFSESGEHALYLTRDNLVTDGYLSRYGAEKIMTAYAPLIDSRGDVIALQGADISLTSVDAKLSAAAWVIALSAIATLALVILSVFFSAHKISVPVQKINNAALEIAAGRYGYTLDIDGPKEIGELANTLNTMSECLEENIERQQQKSAVRERLFGEYECSMMLQEKMFDEPLSFFKDSRLQIAGFKTNAAMMPHGVYALLKKEGDEGVEVSLMECFDGGFNPMYELLRQGTPLQRGGVVSLHYDPALQYINCKVDKMPLPMLWSHHKRGATSVDSITPCAAGDFVLLTSRSFDALFATIMQKEQWFARLMNHFAEEEFDLLSVMVNQELRFLCENSNFEKDLFLIALKVNGS